MIYPCVLNQMPFTKEVRLFNLLSKENCRAVFGAWATVPNRKYIFRVSKGCHSLGWLRSVLFSCWSNAQWSLEIILSAKDNKTCFFNGIMLCQFRFVIQLLRSCLTLCGPMDFCTPGFPDGFTLRTFKPCLGINICILQVFLFHLKPQGRKSGQLNSCDSFA